MIVLYSTYCTVACVNAVAGDDAGGRVVAAFADSSEGGAGGSVAYSESV